MFVLIYLDKRSLFRDMPTEEQIYNLEKLCGLRKLQNFFFIKETALGARVPIIRVQHKETDTPCDISCRNGLSVENSRLIRFVL